MRAVTLASMFFDTDPEVASPFYPLTVSNPSLGTAGLPAWRDAAVGSAQQTAHELVGS